jgi:hypothetical protein
VVISLVEDFILLNLLPLVFVTSSDLSICFFESDSRGVPKIFVAPYKPEYAADRADFAVL